MVAKWQVHLAQRQMNSPIIQIKKSRYKLTGIALDGSIKQTTDQHPPATLALA